MHMWYYMQNNQRLGPVDEATLRALLGAGSVNIDTLVWTAGMTSWVKFGQSSLAANMAMPPAAPTQVYVNPAAQSYGPDRKDRMAYVLLAVLLGFGVHNIYAGYKRTGVIQLLVSFLSCGALWPFMWIWSIIEACTVTQDASRVPFK